MSDTLRFRGTFCKVTDGQGWTRPFKKDVLTKAKKVSWSEWDHAWRRITRYRESIRRRAQIRKARRINRLICREIIPDTTLINWKRGYY